MPQSIISILSQYSRFHTLPTNGNQNHVITIFIYFCRLQRVYGERDRVRWHLMEPWCGLAPWGSIGSTTSITWPRTQRMSPKSHTSIPGSSTFLYFSFVIYEMVIRIFIKLFLQSVQYTFFFRFLNWLYWLLLNIAFIDLYRLFLGCFRIAVEGLWTI